MAHGADVETTPSLMFEDFEIRPGLRQVLRAGGVVPMGARAFDVLMALVTRPDRVVGKAELIDAVWPGMVVEENNLTVQIGTVRRLLGPGVISTVPGRGYQWTGGPPLAAPGSATGVHPAVPSEPMPTPSPSPLASASRSASSSAPSPSPSTAAATTLGLAQVPLPGRAPPPPALIGRDTEFAALQQALRQRPPGGVVSLVGPAGIGKTSLARALAAWLRDPAGAAPGPPPTTTRAALGPVGEVELAALPPQRPDDPGGCDTAALATAVAAALGAPPVSARGPLPSLLHELAYRAEQHLLPRLLVLDNCEHVLAATQALCLALLEVAPDLPLLVTSQAPLNLPGEQVLRLDVLALPVGDDLAQAAASPAVALFCARAAAADPRFELTADNAAAVAEICRRLDGIPLALELAAGRVPLLGIAGLRSHLGQRLDERFGLLRQPGRPAPPRHQTLQAALDWSHALLPAPERRLLRQLSVFNGDFSAEAAQQLASSPEADVWAVLDALGSLVDKSLVSSRPGPAGHRGPDHGLQVPRFGLLETVRAYARAHLEASGEALAVERRHAEHCLALAEAHGGGLLGGDQAAARRRHVVPELDNLRAALSWFLAHDLPQGLRLGAAMTRVWREQGLILEGRKALAALLERTPEAPADPTRLAVLVGLGAMALEQDDAALQRDMGGRVLQASRSLGDTLRESFGHGMLAHAALASDDTARARDHFGDVLRLNRQLGDARGEAETLSNLAFCWLADGALAQAMALLQQALPLARSSAHRWTEAAVLQGLGDVRLAQGDAAGAHDALTESLLLRRGIGHVYQVVAALQSLALVQLSQGHLDAARVSLLEATQACGRHGFGQLDALCLIGAGAIAAQRGQGEAAARLLAAGQAGLAGTPVGRRPHVAQRVDAACNSARALLGDAGWRAATVQARGLTPSELMAMALAVLSGPAPP